ncbi:MAG TPA: STAS domain-containing protein [Thermoleophilaceae bacterium]|jgi:anti-anti-sigma factor|nr:STAS domain-containing protein [Thermoleophilaceae bacterium]
MLADVHFDDHDGSPVARIRGEVDMSNVGQLSTALQNSVTHSAPGLVIDFSETQYLDSAGLHFIFDLGKRLRDRGQRLYLVVPSVSPVAAVLEIVRVDSLAPRCETLEQALELLRAHAEDVPRAHAD